MGACRYKEREKGSLLQERHNKERKQKVFKRRTDQDFAYFSRFRKDPKDLR